MNQRTIDLFSPFDLKAEEPLWKLSAVPGSLNLRSLAPGLLAKAREANQRELALLEAVSLGGGDTERMSRLRKRIAGGADPTPDPSSLQKAARGVLKVGDTVRDRIDGRVGTVTGVRYGGALVDVRYGDGATAIGGADHFTSAEPAAKSFVADPASIF